MNHEARWSLISVLGRAAGPLWCVQRQGSIMAVEVRQMVFVIKLSVWGLWCPLKHALFLAVPGSIYPGTVRT